MKKVAYKIACLWVFSLFIIVGFAQTDNVLPLQYNAKLFHENKLSVAQWHHRNLQVENGNVIIISDTLSLPFIDDFSRNTLRKRNFFPNNNFDTIFYAYGACDSFLNITTTQGRYHLVQTWDYSFDVLNQEVDSTPKSPIIFNFFPNTNSNCFDQLQGTLTVWPEFYHYRFDSSNGNIVGQTLDTTYADTILTYAAEVIKARLDSNTNWVDNNAYWNTTYPVFPPSIGVATLDGLNQFGLPYNKTSPTTVGIADYLTSKPINLGGLSVADSVYLSFYYQSQGLGDWPNRRDSLSLEFYNSYTSKWDVVWNTGGDTVAPSSVAPFKQVLVLVPQTVLPIQNYFYNGFQFRFKNYASLAGNNDHWHIDYVRLNKNRNFTDTTISDIAFVYDVPSVLKNFDEMPAKQYTGANDLTDSLLLYVRNNNFDQATNNPPATPYNIDVNLLYPAPSVVFTTNNVFNAEPLKSILLNPRANYTFTGSSADSISLFTEASLAVSNVNQQNDSLFHAQRFDKTLSYDDGSAERAYGLEGLGLKKFAYEFNLNVPDTLVGFQIHYTNIDVRVEDLVHTFNVWTSLKLNDVAYVDTPLYTSSNKKPLYIDSVNGFATYRLDTPLLLTGKYYLGWSQTDTRNLQVGYDLNTTKGRNHMYIFTNGTWKASSSPTNGSVMMRCVFNEYKGNYTSLKHLEKQAITVYPNPSAGLLYVDAEETLQLSIFNLAGQLMLQEVIQPRQALDIAKLDNGAYFIKLTDDKGTAYATQKLMLVK